MTDSPEPFFKSLRPEDYRRQQVEQTPSTPALPAPQQPGTWRAYLRSRELWTLLGGLLALGLLVGFVVFYVLLPILTRQGETVTVPEVVNLSLAAAEEKFDAQGLNYEVVDSQYYANLPPLTILAQDPQPLDRAKPGRVVYLTVNKATPPDVKLPDITGLELSEAGYLLQNWNLKIGSISYAPGRDRNVVLETFYKGRQVKVGDKIPQGSQLALVVTSGMGNVKVGIPNLVGMTLEEAKSELFSLGLALADIRISERKDEPDGIVYRQLPAYRAADSVKQGSEFYLFVSGSRVKEVKE